LQIIFLENGRVLVGKSLFLFFQQILIDFIFKRITFRSEQTFALFRWAGSVSAFAAAPFLGLTWPVFCEDTGKCGGRSHRNWDQHPFDLAFYLLSFLIRYRDFRGRCDGEMREKLIPKFKVLRHFDQREKRSSA
jgi:hypothetical protein